MRRVLLSLLLLVSCAAPDPRLSTPLQGSDQAAKVTSEQAQRAYDIISAIDYIPFHYTADGCYARALYMAMELAVNELPSSAQFIEGELAPDDYTWWTYHVALMLLVGDATEPTMIDPALATRPLPLHDWIDLSHPAPGYRLFWVPGSVYASDEVLANTTQAPMIESFAELPAFKPQDIADSCRWLHAYIGLEFNLSWPDRDAKRSRLIARTRTLLGELRSLGKLTIDRLDCGAAGAIYP